jgi:hypothetical protein
MGMTSSVNGINASFLQQLGHFPSNRFTISYGGFNSSPSYSTAPHPSQYTFRATYSLPIGTIVLTLFRASDPKKSNRGERKVRLKRITGRYMKAHGTGNKSSIITREIRNVLRSDIAAATSPFFHKYPIPTIVNAKRRINIGTTAICA